MDTLEEENSFTEHHHSEPFLQLPEIVVDDFASKCGCRDVSNDHSMHNSRRSSVSERRKSSILAALRRPSQNIALSVAHAVMKHTRRERTAESENEEKLKRYNRRLVNDSLSIVLSAFYGKLLVVLGIAFPITEILSSQVRPFYYQGYYLYLYLGSVLYVAFMYARLIRKNSAIKSASNKVNTERTNCNGTTPKPIIIRHERAASYGSFYLRLGAIAFGIGNMVYSGLEFGRYFELRNHSTCYSSVLQAITPGLRMLLAIMQIQFIFLNSREMEMSQHKIISRFGLMHMIGTNLCEWLYVLVEETKHEIIHMAEHRNGSMYLEQKYCHIKGIMSSLVSDASSFLFPCTIEYSLICAVILYEMWKKIKNIEVPLEKMRSKKNSVEDIHPDIQHYVNPGKQSGHHFAIDCSNSRRGLFAGILVIVLTIISLIMFFVLSGDPNGANKNAAEYEVNVVELILYIISTVTVITVMYQMRHMKYERHRRADGSLGIGLDNTLLLVAQTGVFIYSIFSVIGSYFTISNSKSSVGLVAEIFSFIQTCLQTIFVLDGGVRKCRNYEQMRKKPGRELITFLIIANMAMWSINALEKNKAEFKPTHLHFFGEWAWTIIAHVSMPLAIFYRFHSTICLFEIWKNVYKGKGLKHQFLTML